VAALGLAAVAAGCGPQTLLGPPAAWPQRWADRSLYHTPHAYIYASSDAAAGEVDRFVARQAQRFRQQHGREPATGLVVVTDKNDEPYAEDLVSLAGIVAADVDDRGPEGSLEEVVEGNQAVIEGLASSFGVSADMVCAVAALPLDRQAASGLIGIPAEEDQTFGWAAGLPTRSASRQAVGSAARKYSKMFLGAVLRVVVAPLMPLAVDRAMKELVVQWEETIDEQMLAADPQLAPLLSARRHETRSYGEGFDDFTLDDLKN
jgi:hypothetical protein